MKFCCFQAYFQDAASKEITVEEIKQRSEKQDISLCEGELEKIENKLNQIQCEMKRSVSKLKYDVYKKRVNHLLTTGEKKIQNAREMLANGEEGRPVVSKLKVNFSDIFKFCTYI